MKKEKFFLFTVLILSVLSFCLNQFVPRWDVSQKEENKKTETGKGKQKENGEKTISTFTQKPPPISQKSFVQNIPRKIYSEDNPVFNDFVQKKWSNIPTKELITRNGKRGKDSFHFTPIEVIQGSQRVFEVSQFAKKEQKFIPKALEFFDYCTKNSQFFLSIRALCYKNLSYFSQRNAIPIPKEESFSKEVIYLASQLPELR